MFRCSSPSISNPTCMIAHCATSGSRWRSPSSCFPTQEAWGRSEPRWIIAKKPLEHECVTSVGRAGAGSRRRSLDATRLLLDVSSLLYRAHFALSDHIFAPDGRPVGAVHGYLDWTARLMASRRADEVVHVYDHDWRPVARTKLYPKYKATRPPEPPELTAQFVLLRQVLDLTEMLQAHTPAWRPRMRSARWCEPPIRTTWSRS